MACLGVSVTGILLSGGLDSLTLAYWKRPDIAFTVNYGQKAAEAEIRASKKICSDLNIRHEIITVNMSEIGSGDLLSTEDCIAAPKSDWWPYRNQLLLTTVCGYILSRNIPVSKILFGTVYSDSYHKDGTKEFFTAFNKLLAIQEGDIQIVTSAIDMTTSDLIKKSKITLEKISWAHSCHKSNFACGQCRGCFKHQNTMDELGWPLS